MYGQFFLLFAIMFTGYLMRKLNVIDDAMNNGVNRFILYFAYPCLIIERIGSLELSDKLLKNFGLAFLVALAFFFLYGFLTYGYAKLRKFPVENSNVAEFSMSNPNNAFMGFPVALIFFGQSGLLFMIAHNAAMNVFMFTYGVILMRRNNTKVGKTGIKTATTALVKFLFNPNILGLLIGLVLSLNEIAIPSIVKDYLLTVGNISTPMAMVFIGSTLATCKFLDLIRDRVIVEGTVIKLFAMPLITFGILYFVPMPMLIKSICILGAAFPTAATVCMLAEQEGQDVELASKMLFLSTILSIGTIPLTIWFINMAI